MDTKIHAHHNDLKQANFYNRKVWKYNKKIILINFSIGINK